MDRTEHIRVVLVEDNDDDAYLIMEALDGYCGVCRIANGEEAYTYLLNPDIAPDVILMDYRIPGMNGVELMKALQAAGREFAYIGLTVDMQVETAIEVMKAGAFDFLPKARGYEVLPEMIVKVHHIHQDRQERRRAEQALRESEARYRALAEENARLLEQARKDAATKTALLHEVNHRVKNNLTSILGLLYTEQRYAKGEDHEVYQAVLDELALRIQAMALIHNMLSASQWTPLLLADIVRQVVHMATRMLPSGKRLHVEIEPGQVLVPAQQANNLALVLNELATNTVKHAFAGRKSARIHVMYTCQDHQVTLTFHDDGPGYPDDVMAFERHNVGLYLVQTLMREDLHGEVLLQNKQGAVTTLCFPLG